MLACLSFIIPTNSFSQLTYPTRYPTAVIPNNAEGNRLFFLYMPMIYDDNVGQDTFKLYYTRVITDVKVRRYLARSVDFGITWNDTQLVSVQDTLKQYESIIKNPDSTNYYMAFNKWNGLKSYMVASTSTDGGFSFLNNDSVMELGEDKSFIWNEDHDEYWGYVRPRNIEKSCNCYTHNCFTIGNGVRKISLMKNNSFFYSSGDWSNRDTILEINSSDYSNPYSPDYRIQTYYMQVFRNGNDWWGLVGMYRVGNNGGETNDTPYVFPEYTSDVELVWSDDGEQWYRTNNRQPFISLHDSINTIYSVGTIVGDSLYIYIQQKVQFFMLAIRLMVVGIHQEHTHYIKENIIVYIYIK